MYAVLYEPLRSVELRPLLTDAHPVIEIREIRDCCFTRFHRSLKKRQPPPLEVVRGVLSKQPRGVGTIHADQRRTEPTVFGDCGFKPRNVVRVNSLDHVPLLRSRWIIESATSLSVPPCSPQQFGAELSRTRHKVHSRTSERPEITANRGLSSDCRRARPGRE